MKTIIFTLDLVLLFIDITLYKLNILTNTKIYVAKYIILSLIAVFIATKESKTKHDINKKYA